MPTDAPLPLRSPSLSLPLSPLRLPPPPLPVTEGLPLFQYLLPAVRRSTAVRETSLSPQVLTPIPLPMPTDAPLPLRLPSPSLPLSPLRLPPPPLPVTEVLPPFLS